MGWRNISSHPKVSMAGSFSKPFLVEYKRADDVRVTAVSRAYTAVVDGFEGLQSIQHGFAYDSADDDLIASWEALHWMPMPETQRHNEEPD